MTGAFLRVKRNNKFEAIEVEYLTDEEREEYLKDDPRLLHWFHIVCNKLGELTPLLEGLEKDGIISIGEE